MTEIRAGEFTDPRIERTSGTGSVHGTWLATVRFRGFDGGQLKFLHAYGDTEDGVRVALLTKLDAARGHELSSLGVDGPAAREYIEAAGHVHELSQALKALELAEASIDNDVKRMLHAQAVTFYGRTFASHVRRGLADFIKISDSDAELSDRLRLLRNRNVAHSENSITVTTPMLSLRREHNEEVSVSGVWSLTREANIPAAFLSDFENLLKRLIQHLSAALAPLKAAVAAEPTRDQLHERFQRPQMIQFNAAPDSEWTPAERRPKFPASRFATMHMTEEPGGEETMIVTFENYPTDSR